MRIKAIILLDDILFDSFQQLKEHHETIQALPEAEDDLYDMTFLVETDKGGFSKKIKFSKEALLFAEASDLEMIVKASVESDKAYKAGPPFETEIKPF